MQPTPTPISAPAAGFLAAPSIYLGYSPASVASGDLRSSGKLDLVTANPASGSVVIFLSQGSGKFSTGVSYPAGSQPVAVAVADVTGDGRPDLVVANGSGNTISVLAGRGDGSFAAPVSYSAGLNPSHAGCGRFLRQGHPGSSRGFGLRRAGCRFCRRRQWRPEQPEALHALEDSHRDHAG